MLKMSEWGTLIVWKKCQNSCN